MAQKDESITEKERKRTNRRRKWRKPAAGFRRVSERASLALPRTHTLAREERKREENEEVEEALGAEKLKEPKKLKKLKKLKRMKRMKKMKETKKRKKINKKNEEDEEEEEEEEVDEEGEEGFYITLVKLTCDKDLKPKNATTRQTKVDCNSSFLLS